MTSNHICQFVKQSETEKFMIFICEGCGRQEKVARCVMCGDPAQYEAIAQYKSGSVKEALCRNCNLNNQEAKLRLGKE